MSKHDDKPPTPRGVIAKIAAAGQGIQRKNAHVLADPTHSGGRDIVSLHRR